MGNAGQLLRPAIENLIGNVVEFGQKSDGVLHLAQGLGRDPQDGFLDPIPAVTKQIAHRLHPAEVSRALFHRLEPFCAKRAAAGSDRALLENAPAQIGRIRIEQQQHLSSPSSRRCLPNRSPTPPRSGRSRPLPWNPAHRGARSRRRRPACWPPHPA